MVHFSLPRIWLRLPYPNNTPSSNNTKYCFSWVIRPSPRPRCSSAGVAPCPVLTNFMAAACSVRKAGLGAWGSGHTLFGTDLSFTIYRRYLDAPEVENSRCKTFLDLWFLIKDLIMSFDIFYSKISPVVSFLNWVSTPCNPTSSVSFHQITVNYPSHYSIAEHALFQQPQLNSYIFCTFLLSHFHTCYAVVLF